ncbi:unnamed protein product [Ilex paraguariensis]|uniref:Myb/SANT-like domain-containing protein n=1 Tax=Ilex paraguariensis TaxID=185542 RepID=A0ABC8T9K3_9AQUA
MEAVAAKWQKFGAASSKDIVKLYGEWKDDRSPASTDLVVDWTPSMDRCFIDLMLEQVHRGNKIDNTFDVQAWAHMVASFNEKLGLQYDRYVLETRYICLMQQYTDINGLLNQNGFAWDETQHIVVADDKIWEAYVKEHPNAILYRNKILQHYNDLCVIFGIGLMDGRVVCQTLVNEFDHSPLGMEINETCQLKNPVMGKETPSGRKKRSAVTPSASSRSSKLQKTGKDIQKSFSDMETMVTKLVNKKADKNHITIESAIDALQAIPDIDDELLLDACDLLEDEKKAKTFLALDATLRKKWLRRKLGR